MPIFVASLWVGGTILVVLAVSLWRQRNPQSRVELTLMLGAAALWVWGAGVENLVTGLSAKVLSAKIQYVGILALGPGVLSTVLISTGHQRAAQRAWRLGLTWAGLCWIVVVTNESHGWIWSAVSLSSPDSRLLLVEYGPGFFWLSLAIHSQVVAAWLVFLLRGSRRNVLDTWAVHVAFVTPWTANLLYLLDWTRGLDLTPLGLVVMGVCFAYVFHYRGGIFAMVKVAYEDVLDHIADPVLVLDARGDLLASNRAADELFEIPLQFAKSDESVVGAAPILSYLDTRPGGELRTLQVETDGERRVYEARSMPYLGRAGRSRGSVVILSNVTENRRAEEALRIQGQQLRQLVDLMPHPMFARSEDGKLLLVNREFARTYQMLPVEMEGRPHKEFHSKRDEIERMLDEDRRVIAEQRSMTREEVVAGETDSPRVYRTTKVPFVSGIDGERAVAGLSINVTDELQRAHRLERLAATDPLTSLANRRHFQDALQKIVQHAKRHHQKAALLFLDLDRFKSVNDVYGHPAGDEVLRQIAQRIADSLRTSDAIARPAREAKGGATISRFGGDEFVILLPKIEEPGNAALVARRLLEAVREPVSFGAETLRLGASIGISLYPADGDEPEILLRRCAQALSRAKEVGRDRFEFYTRDMGEAEERRHTIECALRNAFESSRELELFYQPIWDCASEELDSTEALLRWHSEELGAVPTQEFIAIADETGLVEAVGLGALERVCQQIATWRDDGLKAPRVAINVSPRQVLAPKFVDQFSKVLDRYEVEWSDIEIELTESSVLPKDPIVERNLKDVTARGAKLALDDFGTGFSSLSHLRRFEFSKVKIDRTFISGIGRHAADEDLTRALIALAHRLRMMTVAEGVETSEQLEFLQREGCDLVQGYLTGPPTAARDFEAVLQRGVMPVATAARGLAERVH